MHMLKVYVNRFKNYLIIILALSAVYLTGQLWFEKFSNRNFFYSIISSVTSGQTEAVQHEAHIIKPYRIMINAGDAKIQILYNNPSDTPARLLCDEALTLVLSKGEYVKASDLDWPTLLADKSFLYDYTFDMQPDFFTGTLGQKTVNLASRLKTFNLIAIAPDQADSSGSIRVLFIDEKNKMAYTYSVSDSTLNEGLLAGIDTYTSIADDLFYVSSEQQGLTMFSNNNFVPQWAGDSYAYSVAGVTNPYAPKGDIILPTIESMVEYLFDSPEKRFSGRANGVYTFSNSNTVIRYYPNDTLEYANYRTNNEKAANTTMGASYLTALDFLERDVNIQDDYHLANVETEENAHIFYFGYTIGNFPLKLPETFASDIGMNTPIKITVENNKVTKYKKLVYNFFLDDAHSETATLTFDDCFAGMLPDAARAESVRIDGVSLGYKIENSKNLRMYWFMDMNGVSIITPAQFRGE